MRIGFYTLVIIVLSNLLILSNVSAKGVSRSKLRDSDILAVVNGYPITVREFMYIVGIEHRRENLQSNVPKPNLEDFLWKVIKDRLIIEEAERMGLDTNPWLVAKVKEYTVTSAVRIVYKKEILSKINPTESDLRKFYRNYFKLYEIIYREFDSKEKAESEREELMAKGSENATGIYTKLSLMNDRVLWNLLKGMKPGDISKVEKGANGRWFFVKLLSIKEPTWEFYKKNKLGVKSAYERFMRKDLEDVKLKELKKRYAKIIFLDRKIVEELKDKDVCSLGNDERMVARVGSETLRVVDICKLITQSEFKVELDGLLKNWIDGRIVDHYALGKGYHLKSPLREDIQNYRNQLLKRVFVSVVIAPKIEIKDEELVDYYDKHKDEYRSPTLYRLGRIVVTSEELMRRLITEIQGGSDFKYLAQNYSIDEMSRSLQGDMGWLSYSDIPDNYRKNIKNWKKGEVVYFKDGPHWVILKIEDVREGE
ncbi:MAG: peptidylprolyl isomerase, partial [Thermosulfidibacteraceae bacterium]